MNRILLALLIEFAFGLTAFGQKRKDNQIILVTTEPATSVFDNIYQHLIQNGYEVTNKDEKSGYLTANLVIKSIGAAEIKASIVVKETDSTRATITGTYKANSLGQDLAGIIDYYNPASNKGMWGNLMKIAQSQPNARIKYSKRD